MRRYATVASISHRPQAGCDSAEGRRRLLADAEQLLRRAQRMGADIVAFPEVYPHLTLSNPYQHIEPADGGTLDRVCELARETGMYIIWPRYESSAAGPRNSAILVDRRGTIVGRYYKMFPTIGEMDNGIVPGTECSIFQTDFAG